MNKVLFSELKPGDKFQYAQANYIKVVPRLFVVSEGIKAVLQEKCLFINDNGELLGLSNDFLVVKL